MFTVDESQPHISFIKYKHIPNYPHPPTPSLFSISKDSDLFTRDFHITYSAPSQADSSKQTLTGLWAGAVLKISAKNLVKTLKCCLRAVPITCHKYYAKGFYS